VERRGGGEGGGERGNILRKPWKAEQWWERNEESHLIGLWLTTYRVCPCLFLYLFSAKHLLSHPSVRGITIQYFFFVSISQLMPQKSDRQPDSIPIMMHCLQYNNNKITQTPSPPHGPRWTRLILLSPRSLSALASIQHI
jgi:hypothetical protein